ncbi:hypothetical protein [Tahibacter soli]|uniref:Uncharacterized protein n=1 Tax=Tahibacter soli TaxID=2983605 RepID=A0A9X3YPG0_9GAMM|nr:hypothetical protein [Tahibacter soli]MDC8015437.1 hypothetical protein [Tahibacter soli]
MTTEITTFSNSRDIDECVAHGVGLGIVRSGEACYDMTLTSSASDITVLRLWTSRKGSIDVTVDGEDSTGIDLRREADGGLASLHTHCRELHLEHLARGAYALSFATTGGADGLMRFSTRGYLRCAVVDPARHAGHAPVSV